MPSRACARTLYISEFGIINTRSANYCYAAGDEIAIRFYPILLKKHRILSQYHVLNASFEMTTSL